MRKKNLGEFSFYKKFLASFQMEFDNRVCIEIYVRISIWKQERNLRMQRNFVDYARSLEGVEIGVLVEDRNGKLKGSFRAKERNSASICLLKSFQVVAMLVRQDSMLILPSMSFTLPWFLPSVSI